MGKQERGKRAPYTFILSTMSSAELEFFILMKYSLSVFSFIDCDWSVISKKLSPNPRSPRVSPMFMF